MKKPNTFRSLCIAVAMILTGFCANAQLENSFYLNGSLPTGQLNDVISNTEAKPLLGKDNIGKGAALGLGLGYRASYHFDAGFAEVAPFLNADVQWNKIQSSLGDNLTKAKAAVPQYFNIPVMLGVNFRVPLNDLIKAFGEFGIGTDFFLITKEGWNNSNGVNKYVVNNVLAWQLGAGAYFGSHVSVGIHYYGLGKHSIEYSDKSSGSFYTEDPNRNEVELRSIGSLALRIGFHF